jgi:hypothetical protein
MGERRGAYRILVGKPEGKDTILCLGFRAFKSILYKEPTRCNFGSIVY